MAVINLGIDLGSTGLRAAFSAPGEPVRVVTPGETEWPWLLCEPGKDDALPVYFPSLKSRLGIATVVEADGRRAMPGAVLAQAVVALRDLIAATTPASIGHTVISVPARYFATQRTALLEAAGDAGLLDVSLITDSVAAVLAQTEGAGTGTFLVYSMGYEGFELGLVRAVRGRYRVLGYEGGNAPGGSTFDAQVLHEWLTVLRKHGALPDEIRHGEAGWRRLRAVAERVKKRLATGGPVLFPMFAPGPDRDLKVTVQFDGPPFDRLVRSMCDRTIERADALFEQVGLARDAVETVVLAGGCTRMPQLRELVSGLGAAQVIAADDHIARGALLHAHQLSRRASPAYEEPPATQYSEPAEAVLRAAPLGATLLTAPSGLTAAEPAPLSAVDNARRLIEAGRVDEARDELNRLVQQAQRLLEEIANRPSDAETAASPLGSARASDLIAAARNRLAKGRRTEAISFAHLAWQQEPERPEVFEAMLDIHCEAAMANPSSRTFTQEETWLRCALRHDPSNGRIRALLAQRIYLHGRELHDKGQTDEARATLERALTWDPEHKAAVRLLHQVGSHR